MDPRPEDRWPWLRGGLLGLVPLLLPFVWAVEVDSCGHAPRRTEETGLDLVLELDAEAWAVIVPVLLIAIGTPRLARALLRPGHRLLIHLGGLVASGAALWGAFMVLFFTIFSQRTPRPAGLAFLLTFVGAAVDAVVRTTLAARTLLLARRAGPPPPPGASG